MRLIKKGKEPRSLTEYKKQIGAYFDGFQEKDDIRKQLLIDQGYLCAYCMKRINIRNMKIEHWLPQHGGRDEHSLDFSIMLGVCRGNEGHSENLTTCDTHRGEIPLTISPLCFRDIEKIKYRTNTGEIYSLDEQINHDLNDTLNLNCDGPGACLCANRKVVLEELIKSLTRRKKEGTWDNRILEKYLWIYSNKNKKGKRREYSGIAIWFLRKRINKSDYKFDEK